MNDSKPCNQTTDPDKATWTTEEIGWILSARDQFARNIGCERTGTACAAASFTDPCGCLERAIHRVAGEINDAG